MHLHTAPRHFSWPLVRGVSALIGSIVGVGVFGIPYAFAQAGYALGAVELVVVAGLALILMLMYAEVVEHTPGKHRMVGYAAEYLGRPARLMVALAYALAMWGAMTAYLLLGGTFLQRLIETWEPISLSVSQILLLLVVFVLTVRGIRWLVRIEPLIVAALLILFFTVIVAAIPHMEVRYLFSFDWSAALVPYGVLLFSFSGLGAVAELKGVLGREARQMPKVVLVGFSMIAALYFLFATAVVAVTGPFTTPGAFDGLSLSLGSAFAVFGSLIGVITTTSIFSLLTNSLQNTFRYDLRLPVVPAWFLTVGVPIGLILLGVHSFIEIVGFVGAVLGGTLAIFVVLMYQSLRRRFPHRAPLHIRLSPWVGWILILVFLAGAIAEIVA